MINPNIWENKNVPNHQPGFVFVIVGPWPNLQDTFKSFFAGENVDHDASTEAPTSQEHIASTSGRKSSTSRKSHRLLPVELWSSGPGWRLFPWIDEWIDLVGGFNIWLVYG